MEESSRETYIKRISNFNHSSSSGKGGVECLTLMMKRVTIVLGVEL